jgi:hypothetical protein
MDIKLQHDKTNFIKDTTSAIRTALRDSKWNILLVLILSILAIGSLMIASDISGVDYWLFMKDPVVVTTHPSFSLENPLFVGYFSQLGGMFWFIATGVCLAGALTAKNQPYPMKNMLLHAFVLTLFLGVDDVFMFHDEVFPLYGVHENIFLVTYLVLLFSFLIIYFKPILTTQFPLLALALFFFAASILLDKISGALKEQLHIGFLNSIIFEDGSKMIGILFWLVYFITVIRQATEQAINLKSGNTIKMDSTVEGVSR